MEIEKVIEIIRDHKQTFGLPVQGSKWKPNTDTIACDMAVKALEKMKYFRNCKDCSCLEYTKNVEEGEEDIPYCNKVDYVVIDPECDGCTFYEVLDVERDWGDEQ